MAALFASYGAEVRLVDSDRARSMAEVAMRSDQAGSKVWFDPVGILVEPGTTIRWVVKENVHTTTAYHP